MDFEQLIKRLDWLDEEHRKDKTNIAALEERLSGLEGDLKTANKKIKDLHTGLSKVNVTPTRFEQLEAALTQLRSDITKLIDSQGQFQKETLGELEKRVQMQYDGLTQSISELHKLKSPITQLKREQKALAEEESRRNKLVAEWETRLQEIKKATDDVQRAQRVVEESRKLEVKRLADLQGDLAAARKRLDETREKNDIFTDGLRRVDARINELLTNEAERRQNQISFIETQNRVQVERERAWKEWEGNLESFEKNTETLDRRLHEWDVAQRAVKRAQETYENITQKFERRINEISEMQRLAEDRFRQEWVTFKADDQKRWTSFTLSQDEIRKDVHSELEKLQESITALGDQTQTQQDLIEQTTDSQQQLLQGMVSQIHELLSAYERIMSTK